MAPRFALSFFSFAFRRLAFFRALSLCFAASLRLSVESEPLDRELLPLSSGELDSSEDEPDEGGSSPVGVRSCGRLRRASGDKYCGGGTLSGDVCGPYAWSGSCGYMVK